MAGLDEIPKKQFFTTPEGYFDKLPGNIRQRLTGGENRTPRSTAFAFALKYALPVIVIAAALVYYTSGNPNAEAILASVETQELIDYLHESGMTTEEVLDNIEFTPEELDAIENEVYDISFQDLDKDVAN